VGLWVQDDPLLGGRNRFVLSTSGHIAGIVNPPGPKAKYWTNDTHPASAQQWKDNATLNTGTWCRTGPPGSPSRAAPRSPHPPRRAARTTPCSWPHPAATSASAHEHHTHHPAHTHLPCLPGQHIAMRVQGTGEPLLVLNGLTRPLASWDPLARQLDRRTIISFDAPGLGGSPTQARPVWIAELASIAVAVLDAAGFDNADILGFSHGGAVAQQLAHDAPTRVRSLILAATSCGVGATPGSRRTSFVVSRAGRGSPWPLPDRWASCGSHWRCQAGRASPSLAPFASPRSWSAEVGTVSSLPPTAGSWPGESRGVPDHAAGQGSRSAAEDTAVALARIVEDFLEANSPVQGLRTGS